jgi:asparagine synthase (glutamine-hydrolysing)
VTALAGAWRPDGEPARATCDRMLAAMAPYASAQPRLWSEGPFALGERLTSLTPEDRFCEGPAPLAGGGALVADVRIDNREDVEAMLNLRREEARRLSDQSVLARAWDRWGEGLLDRVIGDFAFAAWQAPARRLTLARDAFGWRPLHYHVGPSSFFAFASMPMGLHALAEVPVAIDEARLAGFLALEDETGPASFFLGIERVEPGALVRFEGGAVSRRVWYAPELRPLRLASPDDYAAALREQLDRAVACRLRGAGEAVGTHLSSGWDSAAVTVTAARLTAASGGRVIAFTAAPREGYDLPAPPGRHGDESLIAAAIAAGHANIAHRVVRPGPRSPLDGLAGTGRLLGRPVMNACNQVWLDEIGRTARSERVKVMLSGEFGNEGLTDGGEDWLADLAAERRWARWLLEAAKALAAGEMRIGGVLRVSFGGDGESAFWRWVRRRREWVGPPGAHSPLPPALWRQTRRTEAHADAVQRRLRAARSMDVGPFHQATLAAFGVDHRAPLMDRRLVEFCLATPRDQIFRHGRARALARRALADRLPPPVLDQPTKGYQGIDWHEGLGAARREARALASRLSSVPTAARLLDLSRLAGLLDDWPEGGWNRGKVFVEYRLALLRGLSAGQFIQSALRANA